jgi:hypothetical protein
VDSENKSAGKPAEKSALSAPSLDKPAAAPTAPVAAPPRRYEIRTPNKLFAGERAGVIFKEGVGETDDLNTAHFLTGLGYSMKDRTPHNRAK